MKTLKPFILLAALLMVTPVRGDENAPAEMAIEVKIDYYSYAPVQNPNPLYYNDPQIDQNEGSRTKSIVLKATDDVRTEFEGSAPKWEGSKDITLKDGYHVKIDAAYIKGKPTHTIISPGVFHVEHNNNGLSINCSYYHDKELIGFQSATDWKKDGVPAVSAKLLDTAYLNLMSQNSLEIPKEIVGYGDGFRFWVAARNALKDDGEKSKTDALVDLLAPLRRKGNLMIPSVNVQCIPAATKDKK